MKFQYQFYSDGFWIRLGEILIRFKTPKDKPPFSERNGYVVPKLKIGGYRFFINKDKRNEHRPTTTS